MKIKTSRCNKVESIKINMEKKLPEIKDMYQLVITKKYWNKLENKKRENYDVCKIIEDIELLSKLYRITVNDINNLNDLIDIFLIPENVQHYLYVFQKLLECGHFTFTDKILDMGIDINMKDIQLSFKCYYELNYFHALDYLLNNGFELNSEIESIRKSKLLNEMRIYILGYKIRQN